MCFSNGEWINKLLHPCDGILFSDKKERTIDKWNNVNESQRHYASEQRKSIKVTTV